ncbi:MAG: hotdog fold thioesterase [Alphaproteobacteria bacterium]|nr:hotdog fold thioesterase [Alphaproteobacteria bacterium]
MSIWFHPITLEDIRKRYAGTTTIHDCLGIKITEVGQDYLRGTMPVDENTVQPMGILHGGASCVLAESLGSVSALFCVDRKLYHTVGLDIHTSHIKSVRTGIVTGTARPVHIGKSTQIWEIKIENESHDLISVTRLTMFVKKNSPTQG